MYGTTFAIGTFTLKYAIVLGCEGKSVELLALFTMRFGAKSSTDLPLIPCTSASTVKKFSLNNHGTSPVEP